MFHRSGSRRPEHAGGVPGDPRCFYGTTRFDDFVDRVGMSAPAVSRALKRLEESGVVTGTPYREPGARTRIEYVLTPRARSCSRCSSPSPSGVMRTCGMGVDRCRSSTPSRDDRAGGGDRGGLRRDLRRRDRRRAGSGRATGLHVSRVTPTG